MTHRAVLVLVIVAAMASVQLVATFATGPRTSQPAASVRTVAGGQAPKLASVALADNGTDNGSNDNSTSSDNSGSDNSSSSDNSGSDNSSSSDNSGSDNSSASTTSGDNSAATGTENPDEIIDNVAPTDVAPVAPAASSRTDAAPP